MLFTFPTTTKIYRKLIVQYILDIKYNISCFLNPSRPNPWQKEKNNFKAFKAFIKAFEAPQRSEKIKI